MTDLLPILMTYGPNWHPYYGQIFKKKIILDIFLFRCDNNTDATGDTQKNDIDTWMTASKKLIMFSNKAQYFLSSVVYFYLMWLRIFSAKLKSLIFDLTPLIFFNGTPYALSHTIFWHQSCYYDELSGLQLDTLKPQHNNIITIAMMR